MTLENNSSVENNSGGTLENNSGGTLKNKSGGTLENNSGGTQKNEQLVLIHYFFYYESLEFLNLESQPRLDFNISLGISSHTFKFTSYNFYRFQKK